MPLLQIIHFSCLADGSLADGPLSQLNGCFQHRWYDACMVMARRLLETLIIECFEQHAIGDRIKNTKNEYPFLGELIDHFLGEQTWAFSRNARNALPKMKEVKRLADMAAHSRNYRVRFGDISGIRDDFRVCVQELVGIAGFDKESS
jgi:hypothetical protein